MFLTAFCSRVYAGSTIAENDIREGQAKSYVKRARTQTQQTQTHARTHRACDALLSHAKTELQVWDASIYCPASFILSSSLVMRTAAWRLVCPSDFLRALLPPMKTLETVQSSVAFCLSSLSGSYHPRMHTQAGKHEQIHLLTLRAAGFPVLSGLARGPGHYPSPHPAPQARGFISGPCVELNHKSGNVGIKFNPRHILRMSYGR